MISLIDKNFSKIITKMNSISNFKIGFLLFIGTTLLTSLDFLFNLIKSPLYEYIDIMSGCYFILAAFGHAAIFSFIIFAIYSLIILITKSKFAAITVYLILAIFLQIIIILDGYVFNIYRFHINGFVLQLVFGAGGDIFIFDKGLITKFLLFSLLTAIVPYIIIVFVSRKLFEKVTKKIVITILTIIIFAITTSHIGHALAAGLREASIQKTAAILPYFYPLTMNSLLLKLGISNKNTSNINQKKNSDVKYPKSLILTSDTIPNYNILYILIDSWNPSTYSDSITPNIFKFSEKSDYFSNHYSSSSGTRGSVFGLFFGAPFSYRKDFSIEKISPVFITELLNREYDIQVFPSANFTSPPFHEDIFRKVPDIHLKVEGKSPFERDKTITEMTLSYLRKKSKDKSPFFALTFFDTAHAISLPQKYNRRFTPAWEQPNYMALNNNIDRTPFFNLYKNCVFYIDGLVGEILEELEKLNFLDNTIVVISGDHGQEFNENHKNYWGHGSNYSEWQTHIPLIVYHPNLINPTKYNHMTTHYDISATILKEYLGVLNDYEDFTIGISLYDTSKRYPHIIGDDINYGFILKDKIIQTNHLGTLEVFDPKMNPLKQNTLKSKEIEEAILKKNHFYN